VIAAAGGIGFGASLPLSPSVVQPGAGSIAVRIAFSLFGTFVLACFEIFLVRVCTEDELPARLAVGNLGVEWTGETAQSTAAPAPLPEQLQRIEAYLLRHQDLLEQFRDFSMETARRLEKLENKGEIQHQRRTRGDGL
jgi:hypothetical protein